MTATGARAVALAAAVVHLKWFSAAQGTTNFDLRPEQADKVIRTAQEFAGFIIGRN